jgi:DNA-binding IclR family transcriptional regulator
VQGSTVLRAMPVEVGQRLPLGVGAGSLAILATLDDEEVRHIVSAQESRFELYPDGRAKAQGILKRVDLTRQQGFSVSSGTVARGVVGVGVAILPKQGRVQLALSVSAVASAIDPSEARKLASVISTAIKNHHGSHRNAPMGGTQLAPGPESEAMSRWIDQPKKSSAARRSEARGA